ncbi:hypothetical protein FRB91_011647 [Serendipita sp. 411]|nr:hypothetical protein FRB91_011647 [Serendipita sp. 411]
MSSPVTYNDFINQNGATTSGGGVWTVDATSKEAICLSVQPFRCRDVTYCISCLTLEWATQTSYTVKFKANVSVPMSQYQNADTLYYDWSYMVAWAADEVPRGLSLTANSYIGDSSYVDTFVSDNMTEMLTTRQTWLGDPFVHSGSTSVAKYGDPTIGYIPITIEVTYPRLPDTSVDYMMKAPNFKITGTTPPATTISASNSTSSPAISTPRSTSQSTTLRHLNSTSTAVSSSAGLSSTPVAVPTFWTASVGSDGQTYSYSLDGGASVGASPPTASPQKKSSSAVIGGAIGGICVLLILIMVMWIRFRRQRRKEETSALTATPASISLVSPWAKRSSGSGAFSSSAIYHDHFNESDSKHAATSLGSTTQGQQSLDDDEIAQDAPPIAATVSRAEIPPPAYSSILSPVGGSDNSRNQARRIPLLALRRSSGVDVPEDLGLSRWAEENRVYISEKLEARLELAGYLPTDDPDAISEEDWERKWSVSNTELARLRMIYAKSHQDP